jgi:hypothetical protein
MLKDPAILSAREKKETGVMETPTPEKTGVEKTTSHKEGGGKVRESLTVKTGAEDLPPTAGPAPAEEVSAGEERPSKLKGTLLTRRDEEAW